MKFKCWILKEMVGTSVFNAGMQDFPGEYLNDKLPVRSKISCGDGKSKAEKHSFSPEKIFGMKNKKKSINKL